MLLQNQRLKLKVKFIKLPCRQLEKIPIHLRLQIIFPKFVPSKIAAHGEPINRRTLSIKLIVRLFVRFDGFVLDILTTIICQNSLF